MARCTKTRNLQVHHRNRYGPNNPSNAEVLCPSCHANTRTYGTSGDRRRKKYPFNSTQKVALIANAKHRCECTRVNCH